MRRLLALLIALPALLLVVAAPAGAAAPSAHMESVHIATKPTGTVEPLTGTVGPGFTINLKQGGNTVTSLKAGAYTIVVDDRSNMHNFHLMGPGGVDMATTVDGVGTVTWQVTLIAGTYTYQCDPHASFMNGSFVVS